jgi:hypothetical protein
MAAVLVVCFTGAAADHDVTRFGAVADGVTDDTAAIQAAIDQAASDGGGRVRFPVAAGAYLVRDTLRITTSGIELEGAGARLLLADGAISGRVAEVLLVSGEEGRPIRDIAIRGLTIDANYFNQLGARGSKAVVFRFAEDSRIEDVAITRPYVGLSLRRSVRVNARRVTVTDYQEDAFDAGGDADLASGGLARGISFIDVEARDAPRAAPDGNAFEIEDGVEGVLILDALVASVAGNGVGMRNHATGGNVNRSSDVELRNVRFEAIGGDYAVFAAARPPDEGALNSYRRIRLLDVTAAAPVAFWGPLRNVELRGGRYSDIQVGFDSAGGPALVDNAVVDLRAEDLDARAVRINGASGGVTLFGVRAATVEHTGAR